MVSLKIEDMKNFTAKLLIGNTFDNFLLSKATIATGTTVTLDGHLNTNYYDSNELISDSDSAPRKYAYWEECKDLAFSRIKGKRLPLSFQFVLLADSKKIALLLEQEKNLSPEQIAGLFLNIQYDGTAITCVTGVSLHTFTLDKTIEHLWDDAILDFFKDHKIATCKLT